MHPLHGNVCVAQGKSGTGWKSKSKLGGLCKEGEQWLQVFQVFVSNVQQMHPISGDGLVPLIDALPPASGKHKFIKWDCKYLIAFQLPKP